MQGGMHRAFVGDVHQARSLHGVERPQLLPCVHARGHYGACTQGGQQQFVRTRTEVVAADGERLVAHRRVALGLDADREGAGAALADAHRAVR